METRSAEEIEDATERLLQDLKAVMNDGEELLKAGARAFPGRFAMLVGSGECSPDDSQRSSARARVPGAHSQR